ncbi:MAG TPA: thioredoxin-dependent thiol peroxidase [Bacteroidales bacterium]|nr:MAG: peroxiredoxin [Bacteroidetes bacterium GWF2_33_38]HBF87754.1 thioredoxin-dependent thiol peroxidase [Bacteroidales bacterium]
MQLKEGDFAPIFKAKNQHGELVKLDSLKGQKVVLYFYPKDNTPGCTSEACDLRDNYQKFIKQGYIILGVSPDSEKSHSNFISKYNLPFALLADTEKEIAKAYGVWTEKKMYGKSYMGILRTTFIISEEGKIEKIITKVDTKAHSIQIING